MQSLTRTDVDSIAQPKETKSINIKHNLLLPLSFQRNTSVHTHTPLHIYTHINSPLHTHIHIYTHSSTHTFSCTSTHTHNTLLYTHTLSYRHIDTNARLHTHTLLPYTHKHRHTQYTPLHIHSTTHPHTLLLTHISTYTLSYIHKHTLNQYTPLNTHTHTHLLQNFSCSHYFKYCLFCREKFPIKYLPRN